MRSGANLIQRKLLTTQVFKEPDGGNLICLSIAQLASSYLSNLIQSIFPTIKSQSSKNGTIFSNLYKNT